MFVLVVVVEVHVSVGEIVESVAGRDPGPLDSRLGPVSESPLWFVVVSVARWTRRRPASAGGRSARSSGTALSTGRRSLFAAAATRGDLSRSHCLPSHGRKCLSRQLSFPVGPSLLLLCLLPGWSRWPSRGSCATTATTHSPRRPTSGGPSTGPTLARRPDFPPGHCWPADWVWAS